jgi:hypothetical protein
MAEFRARWIGGSLIPVGNHSMAIACDAMREGDVVAVTIDHPRSLNSHNHQFAEVADAWHNLPESASMQPWAVSPDALRKHALIVTGFCHSGVVDCGSKAAAERVAAMLKTAETKAHGYCIVIARGPIVTVATPESQSYRAMGAARFQESKTKVLDWIATQIGVTADQMKGAA